MSGNCWLMKSDPEEFSLADLKAAPNGTDCWDGVRNYQARNFMRDDMQAGDRVLFYHSGKQPAVVGLATVVRSGYPDDTALDPDNPHFDQRSSVDNPIWYRVDIQFEKEFSHPLPLAELRSVDELEGMLLLRKGMRLSIQPVSEAHFNVIVALAGEG